MTEGFWHVSLGQLITVAGLLVYGFMANQYCMVEVRSCYEGWNGCRAAMFPNASLISWNASTLNVTNFTSRHSWLGGLPC